MNLDPLALMIPDTIATALACLFVFGSLLIIRWRASHPLVGRRQWGLCDWAGHTACGFIVAHAVNRRGRRRFDNHITGIDLGGRQKANFWSDRIGSAISSGGTSAQAGTDLSRAIKKNHELLICRMHLDS